MEPSHRLRGKVTPRIVCTSEVAIIIMICRVSIIHLNSTPMSTISLRTPKPEERVARAKQAFQDAKNKHAQKLQERMREMEE